MGLTWTWTRPATLPSGFSFAAELAAMAAASRCVRSGRSCHTDVTGSSTTWLSLGALPSQGRACSRVEPGRAG